MKIERTKNTIRNIKWGVLQRLINMLFPFVVRTVLIYEIGAEYAGLSSLFSSILSILSLSQLGFSQAIVYSMYKPIAENDDKKICALLNIYKKAYHIIGTVILVAGLILVPFIPYLINDTVPADINLYSLYLIYLFNTVISYFMYAYKTSLLSAFQREDVISRNTMLCNITLYSLQCAAIITSKNYYYYIILLPISTIILNLINNSAVNHMFPMYHAEGDISSSDKRKLKKNIVGLSIWKVGSATRNTLDSIVISAYLGLIDVAIYNNYYYILNAIVTFINVLTVSITAGIGNKIETDTVDHNYNDFKTIQLLYMWISGICTVCLFCLYQPFMTLWMGEDMLLSNLDMLLFCIYFFLLKQGDVQSIYYHADGLWYEGKMRSVFEALLNVILNLVLGYYMGITGIIIATIISLYIFAYLYGSTFIFRLYFHKGLKSYYLTNLIFFAVTCLACMVTSFCCSLLPVGTSRLEQFILLLLDFVLCLIISNIIFVMFYRKFSYYNRAIKAIKRILHINR